MFPKTHTSHSQLSLYEHCPRCYWLRYVMDLKTPKSEPLQFGGDVHNAIDSYHEFGSVPDNLESHVRAAVMVYASHYQSDYYDVSEQGIDLIYRHPDTNEPLPLPFKMFLDAIRFRGRTIIGEHKTSARPYTQRQVDEAPQATLYSYAFRQMYKMIEDEIRYNVIIKPPFNEGKFKLQILSTHRDNSDYASYWYWAKGLLDRIGEGDFEPHAHTGWKCDACQVCVKV